MGYGFEGALRTIWASSPMILFGVVAVALTLLVILDSLEPCLVDGGSPRDPFRLWLAGVGFFAAIAFVFVA